MSVPIFIIGLMAYAVGFERTWQFFGIPTVIPDFIDSRVITAGFESFKMGYDPLIANPAMPTGNEMNYPRVWQLLFYFDLNQNKTIYLAATCFAFYLLGVFIICNTIEGSIWKIIFLCIAFSPSALLGIERGNVDLIIFGITALAGQLFAINVVFSISLLAIAFILKLYPILAMPFLISMTHPKKILKISLFMLAFIIMYLILKYDELILISNSTPRTFALSYGKNVLHSALSYGLSLDEFSLDIIKLSINLFLLFSSILVISKSYFHARIDSINFKLQCEVFFLAGASIYCGTFWIGNNFEYRLIFLLLVIPFFLDEINKSFDDFRKKISIFFIALVLVTMWSILIMSHMDGKLLRVISFMTNQLAQWMIYYILIYYLTIVFAKRMRFLKI